MLASEITRGLWRWLAPHPEWTPEDDWPELVGSVLYELPEVAVLIDPLLPREQREEFLGWLDERVRGRAVTILTTIGFHRRDREQLAARYRSSTTRAWNWIPPGVRPFYLQGAREIVFWLPDVATLVVGDSLVGADGGVRVCPESWLEDARLDRAGLAARMRELLVLPIERLIVSHGEPVLSGGHAALRGAIEEASAAP